MRTKLTVEERFWAKVNKAPGQGPHGDCWAWTACSWLGYGLFGHGRAHRFAWELANGPIPKGLFVLHHCDNPPCCNAAHLFTGTHLDNMRDMYSKGRDSDRTGENHSQVKLTDSQVVTIRNRRANGETQGSIARDFGITARHVGSLSHGNVRGLKPIAGIERFRGSGERHGMSRLTAIQVLEIREKYRAGEVQAVIAAEYRTSQTNISLIVCRKHWKHI